MKKLILLLINIIFFTSLFAQNILVSTDSTNFPAVEMDEVTVISSKETKNSKLIELPASVSVIGSQKIENENIRSMTGLSGMIPNLFMPDYGTRLTSPIYLRGIGSRINSPSVGLYVDNVPYFEKAAFDFDFFDIERIEVLRGPQGTLYGRNTMGGIINVFTKKPSDIRETSLELSGASYQYYKGSLSHSQPIGEKASLLLNASAFNYGGFYENTFLNKKTDAMQSQSGRLKLLFDPTRRLKTQFTLNLEKSHQEGYPYALYNSETDETEQISYDHPSSYDRWLLSNNFNVKYLWDNFTLNATTSYQFFDGQQDIDQDFTPLKALFVTQDQLQHMISQEITIHSTRPSQYSFVSGVFAFIQDFDSWVDVFYQQDASSFGIPPNMSLYKSYDNLNRGIAYFHQSSYNDFIIDGLSILGGIRLDYEKSEQIYNYDRLMNDETSQIYSDSPAELSSFVFLPKFSVKYSPVKEFNSYFSISKGYKAGGFNTTFEEDKHRSFDPESSINYEVGFKSSLLERRVRANLSLFYIDWKNQQIYQAVPSGRGSMITNAGESYSKGVELEINSAITRNLNAFLNAGINEAKFESYVKNSTTDYSGNYIPYAPKMTLYTGVNYHIPLSGKFIDGIFLQTSYNGFGKHYWHESNEDYQDYYGLMNANITFESKYFEWSFWGKNLLNVDYNSFYFSALGNAYVQRGKPRLIGTSIKIKI
ncbi:MAG: TonB-dependent receptor [Bacteroidota bacterium]